ncbi:unnamed protein product [Amoebophrya sp. A25]|nr:unnamed protein product [Amoebophrya sp. A25]|eukprot:GSA25T00008416001.1
MPSAEAMSSPGNDFDAWLRLFADVLGVALPVSIFLSPMPLFLRALGVGSPVSRSGGGAGSQGGLKNNVTAPPTTATRDFLDMPPLAFTAQLAQCSLWLVYAFLKDIPFLVIANVVGVTTAVVYVLMYPVAIGASTSSRGSSGGSTSIGGDASSPMSQFETMSRRPLTEERADTALYTTSAGSAIGNSTTSTGAGGDATSTTGTSTTTVSNINGVILEQDAKQKSTSTMSTAKRNQYLAQYKVQLSVTIFLGVLASILMFARPEVTFLNIQQSSWLGATDKDSGLAGYLAMTVGTVLLIHPVFTMLEVLRTGNVGLMGSLLMNFVYTACNLVLLVQGLFFINNAALAIQSAVGLGANAAALVVRKIVGDRKG